MKREKNRKQSLGDNFGQDSCEIARARMAKGNGLRKDQRRNTFLRKEVVALTSPDLSCIAYMAVTYSVSIEANFAQNVHSNRFFCYRRPSRLPALTSQVATSFSPFYSLL